MHRDQTRQEELINALIHGIGLLFCLGALPFLLHNALQKHSTGLFWSVLVFGLGMTMVYASSTLYHAVKQGRYKNALLIADHISIYFLIAGTYTPLVVNYLPQHEATIFLVILWSLVGLGSLFKLFYINRFEIVSVILYLFMGWMIVFIIQPIRQAVPAELMWWIVLGGLSYTVGVFFYVRSKVQYFHAIWHCFVLGGTMAHVVFVYNIG